MNSGLLGFSDVSTHASNCESLEDGESLDEEGSGASVVICSSKEAQTVLAKNGIECDFESIFPLLAGEQLLKYYKGPFVKLISDGFVGSRVQLHETMPNGFYQYSEKLKIIDRFSFGSQSIFDQILAENDVIVDMQTVSTRVSELRQERLKEETVRQGKIYFNATRDLKKTLGIISPGILRHLSASYFQKLREFIAKKAGANSSELKIAYVHGGDPALNFDSYELDGFFHYLRKWLIPKNEKFYFLVSQDWGRISAPPPKYVVNQLKDFTRNHISKGSRISALDLNLNWDWSENSGMVWASLTYSVNSKKNFLNKNLLVKESLLVVQTFVLRCSEIKKLAERNDLLCGVAEVGDVAVVSVEVDISLKEVQDVAPSKKYQEKVEFSSRSFLDISLNFLTPMVRTEKDVNGQVSSVLERSTDRIGADQVVTSQCLLEENGTEVPTRVEQIRAILSSLEELGVDVEEKKDFTEEELGLLENIRNISLKIKGYHGILRKYSPEEIKDGMQTKLLQFKKRTEAEKNLIRDMIDSILFRDLRWREFEEELGIFGQHLPPKVYGPSEIVADWPFAGLAAGFVNKSGPYLLRRTPKGPRAIGRIPESIVVAESEITFCKLNKILSLVNNLESRL